MLINKSAKQVQNTLTHITFEMATKYRILPLIGLIPRYLVHAPNQSLDVQRHRSCSVCVQCFRARCSCSLCGSWWNNWLSLFKLSFHSFNLITAIFPRVWSCVSPYYRKCIVYLTKTIKITIGLGCLKSLSTIFQLYRGSKFYWLGKPDYSEKTTICRNRITIQFQHNHMSRYLSDEISVRL